jgi:catechol 2,3-dioxygenase-like lactoylglutathione lyase family enzyme
LSASAKLLGLHHIQLAMPRGGEDTARRFYAGILGLTELEKPSHLAKRGGLWFGLGEQQLHLGVEDEFRSARKAHPAILVRGLGELRRALASQDFAPIDDEPLSGFHRFYVADPFGNRLEFLEQLPSATGGRGGASSRGDEPA